MPRPPVPGPVPDRVGAERRQQVVGIVFAVALRLRELLAVGVVDEPRDRGVAPRQDVLHDVRADDAVEEPRADDLVGLRPHVHREHAVEEVRVVDPARDDVRRDRRRRPGVHHVGVADEPAGLTTLRLVVPVGRVGRRVDRKASLVRGDRTGPIGCAVVEHRVPDREGHAEEALTSDVPVASEAVDPVLVAHPHEVGVPVELATAGQQLVGRRVLDEPLPARDDLERSVAVLPELHRMGDRLRLADHVAGLGEQLDHAGLRLRDRAAGDLGPRAVGGDALRRVLDDAAVTADDRAHRQPELAPPDDVGGVTERADHRDARPLLGIGELVCDDRDLDVEERRANVRAEEGLVARVVRMGDEGDARGDQLGSRRLDVDRFAVVGAAEADAVVRTRPLAILELGLRDRRLEVDVPQRGRLGKVGVTVAQQPEERSLRRAARLRSDRRVRLAPIDREADAGPELEVRLLELLGELAAQRDEVGPRDRDRLLRRPRQERRTPGRRGAKGRR